MPLWIASYPRSGNTFLRIVLRNRFGIRSVDPEWVPGEPVPRTFGETPILRPSYDGPDAPAAPGVRGVKTHGLPANSTDPAVYVVRDGRDTLVSYAHYALTFAYNCPKDQMTTERVRRTIADLINETRSAYGTWSKNVDTWTARPNTVVIKFEELVTTPGPVVDRVAAKLGWGLPVINEHIPSFEELNAVGKRFFRKGTSGTWDEVFTPDLHQLFWKNNGATMTRMGYRKEAPKRAAA